MAVIVSVRTMSATGSGPGSLAEVVTRPLSSTRVRNDSDSTWVTDTNGPAGGAAAPARARSAQAANDGR